MITEIMQKVAAEITRDDANRAFIASLAGAATGRALGAAIAPESLGRRATQLPGFNPMVAHLDNYLAYREPERAIDKLLKNNPEYIKRQNAWGNYRKQYQDNAIKVSDTLFAAKKALDNAVCDKQALEAALPKIEQFLGKNSDKYKDALSRISDYTTQVEKYTPLYEKAVKEQNTLQTAYEQEKAKLYAWRDKYRADMKDKINAKAQAWVDKRNEHINAANQKLIDAEANRVAGINALTAKKWGMRGGIAAGVLLPSAYLAYRKFSNKSKRG